jgi:AraC-like DNA-binding protein
MATPSEEETAVHQLLYQNDVSTPLGRLGIAGIIHHGRGVTPIRPLRVYGSYAVMCVLRGAGLYRDINRQNIDLQAGDAVFVFPELAHQYGPRRNQPSWDEFYITFDGPLFDQWREAGLLDTQHPVQHLGTTAIYTWTEQVQALLERHPATIKERARQTADFATLLGELLRSAQSDSKAINKTEENLVSSSAHSWLGQALQLLDTELGNNVPLAEIAASVNQSYETFRKIFREVTGTTPAHYRTIRRIEAAKALLRFNPNITNREIAETLGFSDEFHFSRRFTHIAGIPPRTFRQGLVKKQDFPLGDLRVTDPKPE